MPRVTRTQRSARAAYKKAADLGALTPVEPAGRGVDGSPKLGPDQVYATRAGMVFHPAWCRVVADKWDDAPDGLLVIEATGVGARRACKSCDEPFAY